ncbi:hypothetical protein QM012_002634 [Aureobasidium pullulans]|uniref:Cryptic loci regulator 2 N-terminal domain-containing protein n=1 Tax=Aureobasidium pullulans TaxID=5580 RepID=A0ABR0TA53_AURPU
MDVDAADQSEGVDVTKSGNDKEIGNEGSKRDKNKGKEGNINMAKLILSRNKGNKIDKHKKRAEAAPAPEENQNNATHYKRTTYACQHELYEDKDGNYVERWDLPDKFTTTHIVDYRDCGSCQMHHTNPWTTVNEHQPYPDVLYNGERVYSLRDMAEAEETGADCPEPCRQQ